MSAVPQCRTLGDLKRQCFDGQPVPPLLEHLEDGLAVEVDNHEFGAVISGGDDSGKSTTRIKGHYILHMVINGEAEVCDTARFLDVWAHRPIRVLRKGDIFGDFAIVDELVETGKSGRARETWKLVAGRRCLLTTKAQGNALGFDLNKEPKDFYMLLASKIPRVDVAKIRIPAKDVASDGTRRALLFRNDLLTHAWRGAKAYRDAVNSFNSVTLLGFRRDAIGLARASPSKLTQRARVKNSLIPFADALFDAINRPLRGEPLFQSGLPEWMQAGALDFLRDNNIYNEDMLSACSCFRGKDFLFPLDLHNILVSKALEFEFNMIKNIAGQTKFHSAVNDLYSASSVRFYKDLAAALIKKHVETDLDYQYALSCEELGGATRRMLVLRYRKKVV